MLRSRPPERWVQAAAALGLCWVGACAGRPATKPSRASSAPTAAVASEPSSHAPSMFSVDAATDAGIGEPIAQEPRFRAALAVADRLLDGELTRAEQRCSVHPMAEREACVDGFLQQWKQETAAKADRRLRSLTALQRSSEAACAHTTKAKREECVLSAMEKQLTELAQTCPDASADLTDECVDRNLLEKNAPR